MEIITFVIAAGETKRFERAGRYIEIIEAAGAIDLFTYDAAGGRVDGARGALSGLYMEHSFSALEVTSGTEQTVKLLLTEGRGGSRRQPGVVQVIDGGRVRSLTNLSFIAGGSISTAAAGEWPVVQLVNPSATKRLLVKKAYWGSDIATAIRLGRLSVSQGEVIANSVNSKLLGGAAMTGTMWRDKPVAMPAAFKQFTAISLAAGAAWSQSFDDPIVIPPNDAIAVIASPGVQTMSVAFEGYEENIL